MTTFLKLQWECGPKSWWASIELQQRQSGRRQFRPQGLKVQRTRQLDPGGCCAGKKKAGKEAAVILDVVQAHPSTALLMVQMLVPSTVTCSDLPPLVAETDSKEGSVL